MAFFKSKQEREIIARMEREEQSELFNEQINELKKKRQEYARLAAEAEINGDNASYELAANALLELTEMISSLTQSKTNFEIINLSNLIAVNMATAMNALDRMANQKRQMPNLRKIQRTQLKMNKYMRNIKISQKAMSSAMKSSSPANRTRTPEELKAVRPLIEAEMAKLTPQISATSRVGVNILEEIEKEKNKLL